MAKARRGSSGTAQLRQRIRSEATRLIAERGFGAISLADVAEGVEVSKQAVLYHFPSKQLLHEAVIEHLLDYANQSLISLVSTLTSDETARINRALELVREFFAREPHAAAVILRSLLDKEEALVGRIRKGAEPWFRLLVEALQRGQREGRFRAELDPEATLVTIGSMITTTFALLPMHEWVEGEPHDWRDRRLRDTIRAIDWILFHDDARPAADAPKAKPAPAAPKSKPRSRR